MTNQQHMLVSLCELSIAIANNSTLEKYRNTSLFVLACDGGGLNRCIIAGETSHLEKHILQTMQNAPDVAVAFDRALQKAFENPELKAKIETARNIRNGDDILFNVFRGGEE